MSRRPLPKYALFITGLAVFIGAGIFGLPYVFATTYQQLADTLSATSSPPVLNKADYNARMLALAHINIASTTLGALALPVDPSATTTATSSPPLLVATTTATSSVSVTGRRWPKSAIYPNADAVLPFHRIVAYYGNFYSKQMGVLGQYPPAQMLAMLASTTAMWQQADPSTPTIPAIDYIAVTAQASAGFDGKYRARMPADQIEKALGLANSVHGLVVLDVQVGKSSVAAEVPLLEQFLKLPQVNLALDPEFDMQASGARPGTVIGTMDAGEINWAIQYLSKLVQDNGLPPKILVIHRFTEDMVTNVAAIKPTPQVEVVMDMDGFGGQAKKIGTYTYVVAPEPIQFTGFKLFYKNDNNPPAHMLSMAQVLGLTPAPVFIQYQ